MKNTKYLTSIRGFACLVVVIAHILSAIPYAGTNFSGCGKIGVWLFFILSAFLLTIQWINKEEFTWKEVIKFYIKRFFRIFPCYIVTLIIAFCVGYIADIKTVIRHIFLMEGMGHFWTIPVEFIFYMFVPFIMLVSKGLNNKRKTMIFFIIIMLISEIFFPYWKYRENSINLIWYLPVFMMGMITAFVYMHCENRRYSNVRCDICTILIMFGMLCSIPYVRKIIFGIEPDSYLQNKYLYFGLAWSIVLLAIQNSKYIITFLNHSKFLFWIGNISFPIYLIHYIVLVKLQITNILISPLVIILISLIGAVLMNKLVEQPMIKLSKKINNKFFKEGKKEWENLKESIHQ